MESSSDTYSNYEMFICVHAGSMIACSRLNTLQNINGCYMFEWVVIFWMNMAISLWMIYEWLLFRRHSTLCFGMNELDDLETLVYKSWVNDKVYNLYRDAVICKRLIFCFTFRSTGLFKFKLKVCRVLPMWKILSVLY